MANEAISSRTPLLRGTVAVLPTDAVTAPPTDVITAPPTDAGTVLPADFATVLPNDVVPEVIPEPKDAVTAPPTDVIAAPPTDAGTVLPADFATVLPNDVVEEAKCTLIMYMDVNRDGRVDEEPVDCPEWQWGDKGKGAVIMVCTRTYRDGEDVDERCELRFKWKWDNEPSKSEKGWQALLTVDHPDRINIYTTRKFNAKPLDLSKGLDIKEHTKKLSPSKGHVSLWMEAADFGADEQEGSWRVKLTFTYTSPKKEASTQEAQLRIAPWIMSSDLDPTDSVIAYGTEKPVDYSQQLTEFVQKTGTVGIKFFKQPGKKPFARDVSKCGWNYGPHCSQLVVQNGLDDRNPSLPIILKYPQVGNLKVPSKQEPTSQDNGGNLLVSPPINGYPLGRIILGSGNEGYLKCRSEKFYKNQRIQKPIVINPTWLSVGHVDEMLSFVPNAKAHDPSDWPWKMLLMSPRLGYIMAYAASSEAAGGKGLGMVDHLLKNVQKVNNMAFQKEADWQAVQILCVKFFGKLAPVGGDGKGGKDFDQIAGPKKYEEDPMPPKGQNGKVVLWKARGDYEVQNIDSYLARPWEGKLFHEILFNHIQPKIDKDRKTLCTGLDLQKQEYVIEVPVLLNLNAAGMCLAHTADSVNMLVLRTKENNANCLIPKPFGPVCGGEYLFQRYLQEKLGIELGLTIKFVNNWDDLHIHDGEIHCGTNQVPKFLPEERSWWFQEPPSSN